MWYNQVMKWGMLYFGYWIVCVGALGFLHRLRAMTPTVALILFTGAMSCNVEMFTLNCQLLGVPLPVWIGRNYWIQFPAFWMGAVAAVVAVYYEKAYFYRLTGRKTIL